MFPNVKNADFFAYNFKNLTNRFKMLTILINLDENDERILKLYKLTDDSEI